MNFDRAHLDHFQQAFLVLDIEIFVFLALVPELERLDVRPETPAGIALEETLAVDARGAAQQAEGPVDDLRQDKGRHAGVIFGQFALGDMAGLGNHAIRMRDRDAVQDETALASSFLRGLRGLASVCTGVSCFTSRGLLILPQSLERGMADMAVLRPLGEGDLAEQRRLDPVNRLPFASGQGRSVSARTGSVSRQPSRAKRSASSRALFIEKPVPTLPA